MKLSFGPKYCEKCGDFSTVDFYCIICKNDKPSFYTLEDDKRLKCSVCGSEYELLNNVQYATITMQANWKLISIKQFGSKKEIDNVNDNH